MLADLRAVRKVKGVAKVPDDAREKGADGEMRHGDIAIALALLLFAIAELEPEELVYHGYESVRPSSVTLQDDDDDDHRHFTGGFGARRGIW